MTPKTHPSLSDLTIWSILELLSSLGWNPRPLYLLFKLLNKLQAQRENLVWKFKS
jgi:hypothetical protein